MYIRVIARDGVETGLTEKQKRKREELELEEKKFKRKGVKSIEFEDIEADTTPTDEAADAPAEPVTTTVDVKSEPEVDDISEHLSQAQRTFLQQ